MGEMCGFLVAVKIESGRRISTRAWAQTGARALLQTFLL